MFQKPPIKLTLHEKISIKGEISRRNYTRGRGWVHPDVVKMTTRTQAVWWWQGVSSRSVASFLGHKLKCES